MSIDDNGKEVFRRERNPEIEAFFNQINITRYLLEACVDFYWFGNPMDEIILDANRNIIGLASQDSSFCRLGLQNPKTGLIDTAYLNANWDQGLYQGELNPIAVLDPYFNRVEQLRNGKKLNYIYPRSFPTPGSVYYGELPWHNLVESGWLDVAAAIPSFKKALFKNQISIKYHIEIADFYWTWKYEGQWEKFTHEEKRQAIKTELDLIDTTLTGSDNAAKSVKSLLKSMPDGQAVSAIKITPLDDKIKSGVYIEDSQEAFSNILFSYGVDPTLVGNAPGKNMGGGSGSDKRVAYNIYLLSTKADADIILEPLHFVRDYNGWGSDLVFMFKNYYVATLEGGKEVSNTGNGGFQQ
jgi:hypothetical protein